MKLFRTKAERESMRQAKAEFDKAGFHVETVWESIKYWFQHKWDRFGSI